MKLNFFLLILILGFVLLTAAEGSERRRRFQRHQRRKDSRKIRSAADCGPHEKFTICGPEPHCEISCDNLFSPPRCQADFTNPRCYYPRCICQEGYVRDADSQRCVAEWRCKMEHHSGRKHYASPAAKRITASKNAKSNPFLFNKPKHENFW
ncbi:hypothetical protein FO519_005076 [Halicephalobus sp. NKZ332]|nr:hypothetical protein FO519_005076 [Halicephalobus sp. NKZ332]